MFLHFFKKEGKACQSTLKNKCGNEDHKGVTTDLIEESDSICYDEITENSIADSVKSATDICLTKNAIEKEKFSCNR